MNIVLTFDKNYTKYAYAVVNSIITHARDKHKFIFVYESFEIEVLKTITRMISEKGHRYKTINFGVNKSIEKIYLKTKKQLSHVSKATLIRLYLPELLEEYDEVLYLDCDVIITGDIQKIKEVVDTEAMINGVQNGHLPRFYWVGVYKGKLNPFKVKNNINAGVLYMNLKKLREFDFQNKTIEWLFKNDHAYKDEAAINVVMNGYINHIPQEFNWLMVENKKIEKKNPGKIPFIIHWNSAKKPWIKKNRPQYSEIYDKYKY